MRRWIRAPARVNLLRLVTYLFLNPYAQAQKLSVMDYELLKASQDQIASELKKRYVGASLDELRTPAFLIDRSLFAKNCSAMIKKASDWGASFRAHLKTHKVSARIMRPAPVKLASDGPRHQAAVTNQRRKYWGCRSFHRQGSMGGMELWIGARECCQRCAYNDNMP
jgi:hypothetical protein